MSERAVTAAAGAGGWTAMMLSAWTARLRRPVELSWTSESWRAVLTSTPTRETAAFEDALVSRLAALPRATHAWADRDLPLFQRQLWMYCSSREHLLFQLSDPDGAPAMQVVLDVLRPRRAPIIARGVAHKLGPAISSKAEWMALRALRELMERVPGMVSLRLQPYRLARAGLRDFCDLARRAGYALTEPVGVTRTLMLDLTPSEDELLAGLSKKTRVKLRHRSRDEVELRRLTSVDWYESCSEASRASMARSGASAESQFDLEAALRLSGEREDLFHALGVFLPSGPATPRAFVIGGAHGAVAEYLAAGSLDDAILRSMPFNYWMVWSLALWAKGRGARWLDLGGVTDGGPGDTRAGISLFKRKFQPVDADVGRELIVNIRPARAQALELWSTLRSRPSLPVPAPAPEPEEE